MMGVKRTVTVVASTVIAINSKMPLHLIHFHCTNFFFASFFILHSSFFVFIIQTYIHPSIPPCTRTLQNRAGKHSVSFFPILSIHPIVSYVTQSPIFIINGITKEKRKRERKRRGKAKSSEFCPISSCVCVGACMYCSSPFTHLRASEKKMREERGGFLYPKSLSGDLI